MHSPNKGNQPSDDKPLLLTREEIARSDSPRAKYVLGLYNDVERETRALASRLVTEQKILLADILQPTELYLAAVNAFCENGTFALPSLPPACPPQLRAPPGALLVAESMPETSMFFEHMARDTYYHRGAQGPELAKKVRAMGLLTINMQAYHEYVDMFQNISRCLARESKYLDAAASIVAKQAAVEIALGSGVTAATPNALSIFDHKGGQLTIRCSGAPNAAEKNSEFFYQIGFRNGDSVVAGNVGYNILAEFKAIAGLPHVHFRLHEEIPFIRKVLEQTAQHLRLSNVTVHSSIHEATKAERIALVLLQRAYVGGGDTMRTILTNAASQLTESGTIIISNASDESVNDISPAELRRILADADVKIVEEQSLSHASPAGKQRSREVLLALSGAELVQEMKRPITSQKKHELIIGRREKGD